MFQVHDKIMYGTQGACEITEIADKNFGREKHRYYVCKSLSRRDETIFVPVDNEKLVAKMQPLLSREEILRLIHDMPGEDPLWEEDETLRKQLHASILSRGDRRELVRLIRSLYLHKKERESKGKKFHQCDERCLNEDEELINSEFSLVLQIPPQQVVSFIRQQLEGPAPETA